MDADDGHVDAECDGGAEDGIQAADAVKGDGAEHDGQAATKDVRQFKLPRGSTGLG